MCNDNNDHDKDNNNHEGNYFQTENNTWVKITEEFQLTSLW